MTPTVLTTNFRRISIPQCRPAGMILCLLVGDTLSLALSGLFAVSWKLIPAGHTASWQAYMRLVPLLPIFLLVYAAIGLYSGVSLGSPEELRRLTLSSILVFLFLGVLTTSLRGTGVLFTSTMALALLLSVVLVPLTRVCVRLKFGGIPWWGYPTVIFGDAPGAQAIIRNLLEDPGLGLKPLAVLAPSEIAPSVEGVPTISPDQLTNLVAGFQGPAYAVLTPSAATYEQLMALIECHRRHFSHILVIPGYSRFSCLWVNPKNVGGMLGLEVCQQVFLPSRQLLKRFIDLILTVMLCLILAPVLIAIGIAIKISSEGPIIYSHRRIGRGGREFVAWKFRSMVTNADEILAKYLADNPQCWEEWTQSQKLRNDPRVTCLGKFLRRTSLDELPQLWNVVRGDMSLVGPRPIVREEIARYGVDFETYTWVPSGLTGLWQVSGRSETSYQQRVDYDRFYVHNWSVWLDLCILFRTIGTVLSRAGAF